MQPKAPGSYFLLRGALSDRDSFLGGEEIEELLLHRLLKNFRQGLGVGVQLALIIRGSPGLRLGCYPVRFEVDDDQALRFDQAAVRHALEHDLLPGGLGEIGPGIGQDGEFKLPDAVRRV